MTKIQRLASFAVFGAVVVAGVTAATPALAYVGPGAGLSLLGALWGLLVAVAVTIGFVILWPLRRLFRRKAQAVPSTSARAQAGDGQNATPSS